MALTTKLVAVASVAVQSVNAYGSYIEDCMEFAAEFSNSCGGTWTEDYAF